MIGAQVYAVDDGTDVTSLGAEVEVRAAATATLNNTPCDYVIKVNGGSASTTEAVRVKSDRGVILDNATGGSQGA